MTPHEITVPPTQEVILKVCTRCSTAKFLNEFGNHPQGRHGKHSHCRLCTNERSSLYAKKRRLQDPQWNRNKCKKWASRNDNARRSSLRLLYGIELEDYDLMLASQGGGCAICGGKQPDGRGKSFIVDHDHETGKIRGLLHSKCNFAIGLMMDSPDICKKAAAYLERTKGR